MTKADHVPRVLHLIDTGGPGGAETVFLSLAADAGQRGHNAGVVVPYDGWLAGRLREHGVTPLFLPAKQGMSLALARGLLSLSWTTRASLIHSHLLGASVYAALAGALLGLPVIAVFHGAPDLGSGGSLPGIKRWLLTRPHVRIIAVSEAVRKSLQEWGIPFDQVHLIRNGVDTHAYVPGAARSLQRELGLPDGTRIVGAVGNLRVAKAYDVLVAAARYVLDAEPDVHFAIAGSGKDSDVAMLRSQVASLGLEDRFHLLGYRPSSAGLYQSLAVFASSARSEGLPLSFLEAMACGVAIAATANEGSGPLLTETSAGLLSPVGDPAALAASIIRLLRDADLSQRLADKGRRAACESFSLDKTLCEYRALYQELV